jgi:hypothetical protein
MNTKLTANGICAVGLGLVIYGLFLLNAPATGQLARSHSFVYVSFLAGGLVLLLATSILVKATKRT